MHPQARTQASFKALGYSYNCRRLTDGSFQLTHMPRDVYAVQLIEPWRPKNQDRTSLQRSQRCHKGEFRHASISARQQSLRCGHNLCRPFLRATLAMTVGSCARAMAATGRQRAHNSTTEVSFCTIMFVSLHDSDHEGVVRIFAALSCELGGLFNLINYLLLINVNK